MIEYDAETSLTAMFFAQAERLAAQPLFWSKPKGGTYESLSWADAASQVEALSRFLTDLGIAPGDRVMLVSENRPEWAIADLAIMAAGAITVPAYVTNTTADHLHILNNATPKAVIVSTRALAERLLPACWQASHTPIVIAIEDLPRQQDQGVTVHLWRQALEQGGSKAPGRPRFLEAKRTDTACLIYTSGTGGAPKGVMLSHGALLHNCKGAFELLKTMGLSDEVFLCFLPLSHSYEHTAGLYFPLSVGAQIFYAESIDALTINLTEAKPTIMTAVPRLYEVMRGKILAGVARSGGLKARLFHAAIALGTKRIEDPSQLSLRERAFDLLLDRLVRNKVRARFGGRLKAMVSGGAPLNYDVGMFFAALGVRILQGYGLTETGPVLSCNPPQRVKLKTVGPPLADTEIHIAEDGEILARGEMVMQGYWQDPEATAKVIDTDGWLHTGDIGEFDSDGYIRITDRKKDIIVNSGGDNIAPQRVEGFLTLQPEIAQAMVFGDRRPHLVALVVPNPDWLATFARSNGTSPSALPDADLRKAIGDAIDRVNKTLSPIEKVRRFVVANEPFSVDNGQMTPTLKIRRHVIRDAYGEQLEALYGDR